MKTLISRMLQGGAMLATVLAALLLNMTACQNGGPANKKHSEADSLKLVAEDMARTVSRTGDVERTFELTDSLLAQGRLSPIKADFYRALAYSNAGNSKKLHEYMKKIIETYDNIDEEPRLYSSVAHSLASYYMSLNQYEEALRVALPAFATLEPDPDITSERKGNILTIIGGCQKELNRLDEAEKNFEQAYQYYKKYMEGENVNLVYFRSCINGVSNISSVYSSIETLKEQQKWTNRCDSLLTWYRNQPDADPMFVDEKDGQIALKRAEIFFGQGDKAAAAKAYDIFLMTDYSTTDQARLFSCNYLNSVGRYAEAADIFQDFDRIADEWEMKPNLEVIKTYLFPKFDSNYRAGRKDSALAVAVKISSLIGPAVIAQKNDAATELATIYETQEKEAQIARQQAELSQQRVVGLVIAIVSLVIFFIIYTLVRHHAAKRLAEARAAQERMESELNIARNIQMSMVPSSFPDMEGLDMYASMTPAREVGGDLYSYLQKGTMLYFCVGDVSGKGVPASLFMAQATRQFHMLASQDMKPAKIVTRINAELAEDNPESMFVTMFVGLLDLLTGHLDFCNAGHVAPILCEKGTANGEKGSHFLDMLPNAPIGLWPNLEYEGEEIDNIKGQPLFIYTDGLNEAENEQQEQFGEERLLELLRNIPFSSARQVIETVAEAVSHHRNGAEPNDDFTMMCLRVD